MSLELDSQGSYIVQEFAMLCGTVFSLPQLENLELVLGKGFADMLRNQHFEDEMHISWNKKGGGVKLKSISLQAHTDKEFKKMKLIAHTLSFSSPKVCEYFDDDDDYYMYSDAYYNYDPWQHLESDYDSEDVDYCDWLRYIHDNMTMCDYNTSYFQEGGCCITCTSYQYCGILCFILCTHAQ